MSLSASPDTPIVHICKAFPLVSSPAPQSHSLGPHNALMMSMPHVPFIPNDLEPPEHLADCEEPEDFGARDADHGPLRAGHVAESGDHGAGGDAGGGGGGGAG